MELRLFLGNKQATVQLGSLGLSLTQAVPELAVTVGQVPAALSPKQQVQVGHQGCSIDVDCVCLCAEKGEMWPACACTLSPHFLARSVVPVILFLPTLVPTMFP